MPQTFSAAHWLTLHTLVVLAAVLVYLSLSLATRQRRHPSAALGWVLSLVLMPYIALPVFLLFGNRKTVRAPAHRLAGAHVSDVPAAGGRFQALASGLGLPDPVP